MKKLSEILTGPETWCQGAMQRGEQVCLLGALNLLIPGNWEPELVRLRRIIVEEFGSLPPLPPAGVGVDRIAIWNDNPTRTWADITRVIDAFDRDRVLRP